jgi:small subunit ribosomal protein S7
MRGKAASKRVVKPDAKYDSPTVAKLINYVMTDGKKNTAKKVVYGAFAKIAEKTEQDPLEMFDRALKNIMPTVEVKSKRVGGANYQIPMQVRGDRRLTLGLRWLLNATRTRKGRPMADKLADELIAAAAGEGEAVKKRADVTRMAEANRAFAHFAR